MYLRICAFALLITITLSSPGGEPTFYRISSTTNSSIAEFTTDGLITWTNFTSNAVSSVEYTTNLTSNTWSVVPVHAIVANLEDQTTALVPPFPTNAPSVILVESNVWTRAGDTIEIPPYTYRLEAIVEVHTTFFPSGYSYLWTRIDIIETDTTPIPASLHITAVSLNWQGLLDWILPTPEEVILDPHILTSIDNNTTYPRILQQGGLVEVRVIVTDNGTQYLLKTETEIAVVFVP